MQPVPVSQLPHGAPLVVAVEVMGKELKAIAGAVIRAAARQGWTGKANPTTDAVIDPEALYLIVMPGT